MDESKPRRIDVHHHFLPPAYLSAVGEDRLAAVTAAGRVSAWSAERSLELMEFAGIETSIVSIPSPNYPIGDAGQTASLCRSCNELAAQVAHDHPGRFGLFASLLLLPAIDMERALKEIEYCLDVLRGDGVALRSNYQGKHLGDPFFDPLWEELDRRRCVVHVHPAAPPDTAAMPGISLSTLEYPFDTTRTIVSMLFHGTTQRFPGIRVIFAHAGGTIPYLAGRIAAFSDMNPHFRQKGFAGAIPALRSFYYDTTESANRCTFRSLLELVPIDHLVFGSDIPFAERRIARTTAEIAELGLAPEQLKAIDRDNALALFPGLHRA